MRRPRPLRLAAALTLVASALSAAGCGTFFNLSRGDGTMFLGRTEVYGGVILDLTVMGRIPIAFPLVLVDLPLSFAADTVLLPIYLVMTADDPGSYDESDDDESDDVRTVTANDATLDYANRPCTCGGQLETYVDASPRCGVYRCEVRARIRGDPATASAFFATLLSEGDDDAKLRAVGALADTLSAYYRASDPWPAEVTKTLLPTLRALGDHPNRGIAWEARRAVAELSGLR